MEGGVMFLARSIMATIKLKSKTKQHLGTEGCGQNCGKISAQALRRSKFLVTEE